MTAEIVRYEEPSADLTTMQQAADFTSWAPKLASAAAVAREISNTEFVPAALRGKPAAVTAAILAGSEIGIGPMASLNQIHVIDGRPALSAELARALVLAHGHHIRYREMTTTRCVVEGRRRGEDDWATVVWTMDDAKAANLNGRTNWRRYPRRMLAARATSELCRLLFADTLTGMAWSVEELEDESDDVALGQGDTNGQAKPRTAKRKTATRRKATTSKTTPPTPPPAAAEAAAPALPDEDDPDGPGEAAPITPAQMTKLHAIFTEHDIADRDERLRISAAVVDRDLASSKDLTLAEAGVLIDTLERCAQSPDGFTTAVAELLDVDDSEPAVDRIDQIPDDVAADLVRVVTGDKRRTQPTGLSGQEGADLQLLVDAFVGDVLTIGPGPSLQTVNGDPVTIDQVRAASQGEPRQATLDGDG